MNHSKTKSSFSQFDTRQYLHIFTILNLFSIRDVVSTGPLARGHLIWPLGHLLLDSTSPDWPPTFKA